MEGSLEEQAAPERGRIPPLMSSSAEGRGGRGISPVAQSLI